MKEYIVQAYAQETIDSFDAYNAPELVRCKDCKHRPREIPFITSWGETQTYLEFPNDSKCPCWNPSEEYYSWNPDDDWFCADGERKCK